MRFIEKQPEPSEFTSWKSKNKGINYQVLQQFPEIKRKLKYSLIHEQHCICCYCEKRINTATSTIEHLLPIDKFPKLQLDYDNILASCNSGNHCNQKRGNKDLKVHPLQNNVSKRFQFYLSFKGGKNPIVLIKGDDDAINTLNLNENQLARDRGKTLMGLVSEQYNKFDIDSLSELEKMQLIEGISNPNEDNELQQFISSIMYILR